jgi:2-oxoglutarate dehydrogenase E2 component (dihydrolipoamide succinyltransferase)
MEIKVPPLGESVTEATVGRWHKAVGEAVALDDILVELETDKITLEVNATAAGRLDEITAPEGDDVEVGGLLGRLAEGEAGTAPEPEPALEPKQAAAPEPTPEPVPELVPSSEPAAEPAPAAEATPAVETAALSPAVRRLIDEHDLDPAAIAGSGKQGRILKADVLAALEGASAPTPVPAAEAPAPATPAAPAIPRGPRPEAAREKRVRMTRLRQRIAERLTAAQAQSALLTTFNEVDMTSVIQTRRLFRDRFEAKHGVKLGFMSFFAKAAVAALKEIPDVNAEIEGDEIVYKGYFHIGVAVSAPQGLVVPVLRDVDRLSLAEIEAGIAALGQRARDGKLSLEDLSGGTFTISNGGIFGSLLSTPIVNPPQSAILGMHKIQERPVAVDGRVEIRPMMYLALSYDHRLIDGREAVTFLVRIKELIEHPEGALLDL